MNHPRAVITLVAAALLSCAALASACGGDDNGNIYSGKAVTPPDNPERNLPSMGAPDNDAGHPFPDIGVADADSPQNAGQGETDAGQGADCCPITFAINDPHPDVTATWGHLRGTIAPLDTPDGVELTLDTGVWSAQACVPPDSVGTYHFEFAYPSDNGGQDYVESDTSPYVPVTNGPDGAANQWHTVEDCASLDTAIYAKTSD